jgi:hypothetical protein
MSQAICFIEGMNADRAIARFAEAQHGLVTRAQALGAGLGSDGIRRRVLGGRWERIHPGVFRLAGTRRTWEHVLMAACLAAGPEAVASHHAAAALHGWSVSDKRIHLGVPRGKHPRVAGAVIHRTALAPWDIDRRHGIPVTSRIRTLIDLSAVVGATELADLLDDALARRSVDLSDLKDRLEALGRGRKGSGNLLAAIRVRQGTDRPSGSRLQTRLRTALRGASIPLPQEEYEVRLPNGRKRYIDFAYPQVKLALEADSYRHHSSFKDWASDQERNNDLAAIGWRILRFTYGGLVRDPGGVAKRVARALAGPEVGPF